MNYLELVNSLKNKAGIAGPRILSVKTHANHMNELLCDWIKDAWISIQTDPNLRGNFLYKRDQLFRLDPHHFAYEYTHEDLQLSDDVRIDFEQMYYKKADWDDRQFKPLIKRGENEINTRVPTEPVPRYVVPTSPTSFFLVPTNSVRGWIRVDLWDKPQVLQDENDLPAELPDYLHPLIVYKALQDYAVYDAAPELLAYSQERYGDYLRRAYHLFNVNTQPKYVKFNKF